MYVIQANERLGYRGLPEYLHKPPQIGVFIWIAYARNSVLRRAQNCKVSGRDGPHALVDRTLSRHTHAH